MGGRSSRRRARSRVLNVSVIVFQPQEITRPTMAYGSCGGVRVTGFTCPTDARALMRKVTNVDTLGFDVKTAWRRTAALERVNHGGGSRGTGDGGAPDSEDSRFKGSVSLRRRWRRSALDRLPSLRRRRLICPDRSGARRNQMTSVLDSSGLLALKGSAGLRLIKQDNLICASGGGASDTDRK